MGSGKGTMRGVHTDNSSAREATHEGRVGLRDRGRLRKYYRELTAVSRAMTFDDFLTMLEKLSHKQKKPPVDIGAEMVIKQRLSRPEKPAKSEPTVRVLRDGRRVFYSR